MRPNGFSVGEWTEAGGLRAQKRTAVGHHWRRGAGKSFSIGPAFASLFGVFDMKSFRRAFARLGALFASMAVAVPLLAQPSVALHYGKAPPLDALRIFDIVVVEPDHGIDPRRDARPGSALYAYVSVAEVQPSRAYFKAIPEPWKLARNGDWASVVIDQTPADWPAFFADRVVGPLWNRGFRGFFLDTLDSYRLARNFDEQAQQDGLVRVIELLHQRFPGIKLILNRGFEVVPRLQGKIQMVAAESLYQGWNARAKRYQAVPASDRQWLLGQLEAVHRRWKIPVLVIDYVQPYDRKLSRETAQRIRAHGFIPWVTDADLRSVGVSALESVPRRVLVVYDSAESPALNYSNAHRYLQMPLNQLGYVVDYADARKPLPEDVYGDLYAGVVTWFSGYLPAAEGKSLAAWLSRRLEQGMPLAVIGDFGFAPDKRLATQLGLQIDDNSVRNAKLSTVDPMLGFEIKPYFDPAQFVPIRLLTPTARPLLSVQDDQSRQYAVGAIMPWGGFILDPLAVVEVPGTEQWRWVVDPFAFLQQALQLAPLPIPDITTENGRRLMFSHIDGDGFPSRAELPGSPLAAEVLLTQVLEKYRVPTTMSVIEAEVSPQGLYPAQSRQMEDIARRMFRLPHVEIASHSYSHPFLWNTEVLHGKFKKAHEDEYHLPVPGYEMNLEREIVGSIDYIQQRLAPSGKPVNILLWTGDTAPGEEALRIVNERRLLNMNGGDTSITRSNPSLTAVGAHGIVKGGYLQVYAPITNENIYTNLWRGPFYGFERVIETFEMTEKPRRLKPVNVYYHTYSASKKAGLIALDRIYAWVNKQSLHPIFASEYIRKVEDFHHLALARDGDGQWLVRGEGQLRTLRLPAALGRPQMATAQGVAGYRAAFEGVYLHLTGGQALFSTAAAASPRAPYLHEANARLTDWAIDSASKKGQFSLAGHAPLEFTLAAAEACRVTAGGQRLRPQLTQGADGQTLAHFKLSRVSETLQLSCD